MRRPTLPRPNGLRERVTERTPEPPDVPSVPTPTPPGRSTLRRATTGLLAVGLSLTGLGLLVRYLLGRGEDEPFEVVEDVPPDPEPTWDYDGPRIAPLVGMAALVAMRLVVERVRKGRAATGDV